ncbi:MAG: N4-gp56 family major capsid protein [Eubacterium sp.]|nr:N4-gp56 family major capsid protein [Eubacterium sp.]
MDELLYLQLFANANTNVTTDSSTGNDLSPTMKEYYNTELLENARADLYFSQFGQKQPLPEGTGNIVEFRRWETFAKATTPLTEGVTPDGNSLSMTKVKAQIEQYGDYSTISDRLELEAVDDVILGATEEHGAQAGETLDTVTRNEVITGTNVIYGGDNVTSRSALTADDTITTTLVNKCATALKKMKAPKKDGYYIAIIHPSVSEDLRECEGWVEAHKYASPEEIYNGEIGKLHGVRFVETTEQKVYCGEDLASDSRTLTVNGAASASETVTFDVGTVGVDALVDRYVLIDGTQYLVTANTDTTLTLADPLTEEAASVTCDDDTVIYPGEGGAEGCATYAVTVFGKDAWGVIEPTAEGMEMIIKSRGSGGTEDPLDQRSTVGWKASHAAKILYEERLVRLEVGSSYSGVDEGN